VITTIAYFGQGLAALGAPSLTAADVAQAKQFVRSGAVQEYNSLQAVRGEQR
jgi:hypothetical protein